MRDTLIETGYSFGWRLVRAAPESVVSAVFRAGADRATRRAGPGVLQLRRNLRRVVGDDIGQDTMDVLVRDAMRSYARYWREAFRLPSYSRDDLVAKFRLDGIEAFDRHREDGIGVIVAIPHSGNWDLAGASVAARGYPITTVAERLRPEGLYEKFLDFRRSLGMEILPHTGGDRPVLPVLSNRLREGHVVPLVADRDLSSSGAEVTFFGERARMPVGPALLAARTGAPLYTVVIRYDSPTTAYGKLEGPIQIPSVGRLADRVAVATQSIADAFAAGIARAPADWHMLQRLWLADLDGSAPTE